MDDATFLHEKWKRESLIRGNRIFIDGDFTIRGSAQFIHCDIKAQRIILPATNNLITNCHLEPGIQMSFIKERPSRPLPLCDCKRAEIMPGYEHCWYCEGYK